jgi:hypothetical protein
MSIFRCGPSGGPRGDGSFNDQIPDSHDIVAVTFRSGSWIDGIQVITRGAFGGPLLFHPYHGGSGGSFGVLALDPGDEIREISGTSGDFIDSIQLLTEFSRIVTFGVSNPSHTPFLYKVPPGHQLAGIFGRSGNYLDALGLILRTTPVRTP